MANRRRAIIMNTAERAASGISRKPLTKYRPYLGRYYSFYLLPVFHLPIPIRRRAIAFSSAMKITIGSLHLPSIVANVL